MSNMADGIREGLIGYQTIMGARRQQQQQDMQAKVAGFQQNPQTGDYEMSPQAQGLLDRKRQAEDKQYQTQLDESDPDSEASKAAVDFYKQNGAKGVEGKSASQLKELGASGLVGKQLSGQFQLQAAALRGQGMQGRLDEQKNKNSAQAGNEFEHQLKPFKTVDNSLDRALSILNSDQPVTATQLNVAKQDYVNAVAQGGQATEGKASREIENTWFDAINRAQYKWGDAADLRKSEPQIIDNLKTNIQNMKGEWNRTRSQQASDIADSYGANTNPRVQDTIKTKLQRYAPDVYSQKFGNQQAPSSYGTSNQGLVNSSTSQSGTPQQFTPDVINYSSTHGITPAQALAIKLQRTGGQ